MKTDLNRLFAATLLSVATGAVFAQDNASRLFGAFTCFLRRLKKVVGEVKARRFGRKHDHSIWKMSLWAHIPRLFEARLCLMLRAGISGCVLLAVVNVHGGNQQITVYQIDRAADASSPSDLLRTSPHGRQPVGSVLVGPDGYLYGTTAFGGKYGYGTVFKVKPDGKDFHVVHYFGARLKNPAWSLTDGQYPLVGLVLDNKGFLWGTTSGGGTPPPGFGGGSGGGTVFMVSTNDDGSDQIDKYTVLHAFGGIAYDGANNALTDGRTPYSPLAMSLDGSTFYGTCVWGGGPVDFSSSEANAGIVYAIARPTPAPFPYTTNIVAIAVVPYVVLHSFGGTAGENYADGLYPSGSLLLSQDGNWLYGTTQQGGEGSVVANGYSLGTVYVVSVNGDNSGAIPGNYRKLYSFTGLNDGGLPSAGLVRSGTSLFGTTVLGQNFGVRGTVNTVNNGVGGTAFSIKVNVGTGTTAPTYVQGSIHGWPIIEPLNTGASDMPGSGFENMYDVPNGGSLCFFSSDLISGPGLLLGTTGGELYATTTDGLNFGQIFTYPLYDPFNSDGTLNQSDQGNATQFPVGGLAAFTPPPNRFVPFPSPVIYGYLAPTFAPTLLPVLPYFVETSPEYANNGPELLVEYSLLPDPTIAGGVITWPDPPNVVLQSATNLTGPWSTIVGAISPYTYSNTAPQQFFRLAYSLSGSPAVATLPANNLGNNSATIYGSVIPNGINGTAWFQYGTTTNYGSTTSTTVFSATNDLYFSNAITGLAPGSVYHYRVVASNSAGVGTGADFTFTSLPIGAGAPSAATMAATSITGTTAVFNGGVTPNGVDTTVLWQYGTTTNYGLSTLTLLVSATNITATAVTNLVSGLLPGVLYHFQLAAGNSAGFSSGGDLTFTTPAAAPGVATLQASIIDPTDAILNGLVVANGLNSAAWFRYGPTTNYGSLTPPTMVSATNALFLNNLISGLSAGILYHYQLVASNSAGTATGVDLTFTASPTVTTLPASDIGPAGATLNGSVVADGADSTAWFQYGTTTNYGNATPTIFVSATNALFLSDSISGLSAGMTYHYQLVASNSAGTSAGADLTFSTLQTITALPADGIGTTEATLYGLVTPNGFDCTAYFLYGTTTNYGQYTSSVFVSATNATAVEVTNLIAGLLPATLYHFQLVASSSGGTATGDDSTFTTVPPIYVGNSLTVSNGAPDGGAPLVVLSEYSPAGPLAAASPVTTLPSGTVQDVKFYGQNYNFTLYALSYVANGPNPNEQTFQVVAAQSFSGSNLTPGIQTLAVTNFPVYTGDLLAFAGTGPYYPQNPNDATNSDATYEDSSNPGSSTATPPGGPGTVFTVGLYTDPSATYEYISDVFGNQGRTYGIGVDVSVP